MAKDIYGNPSTPVTGTDIDIDYGTAVVDRIVGIYPDATARDAALVSPDTGQQIYLSGTDEAQIYTGAAWATIKRAGDSDPDNDLETSADSFADTTFKTLALLDSGNAWASDTEVTVTTGADALVLIKGRLQNSVSGAYTYLSFSVSGASTIAANSRAGMYYVTKSAGDRAFFGTFHLQTGLTPGSNTFTLEAMVDSGMGTLDDMEIAVIPL